MICKLVFKNDYGDFFKRCFAFIDELRIHCLNLNLIVNLIVWSYSTPRCFIQEQIIRNTESRNKNIIRKKKRNTNKRDRVSERERERENN